MVLILAPRQDTNKVKTNSYTTMGFKITLKHRDNCRLGCFDQCKDLIAKREVVCRIGVVYDGFDCALLIDLESSSRYAGVYFINSRSTSSSSARLHHV